MDPGFLYRRQTFQYCLPLLGMPELINFSGLHFIYGTSGFHLLGLCTISWTKDLRHLNMLVLPRLLTFTSNYFNNLIEQWCLISPLLALFDKKWVPEAARWLQIKWTCGNISDNGQLPYPHTCGYLNSNSNSTCYPHKWFSSASD